MLDPHKTCVYGFAASIVATLVSTALAQGTPPPSRHRAWTVIPDGDAPAILELVPQETGATALRFARLEPLRNQLEPQTWRTVVLFKRWTGAWQTVTARRLSGGDWVIAQSELAGGAHVIQYARVDSDLRTLTTPVAGWPELIDSVRLADPASAARPQLVDVSAPWIVERSGQPYLIGEAYLHRSPPDDHVIWVAPVKTAPQERRAARALQAGRIIATGEEPRVVEWEGRFVVTAQKPRDGVDRAWGKPIKVYQSTDLETWKPMGEPDAALEFYGYDLTVHRGQLTLVGAVDASERSGRPPRGGRAEYRPPLELVVLTYAAHQDAWDTALQRPDAGLTTERADVRLLPPAAVGGALKLVRHEAEGRFTLIPVSD